MKLLWVSAPKLGSKAIRWGLDSDCSHFAVSFNESEVREFAFGDNYGIVFHSYGKGTQIEWLKTFLEKYEVRHALEPAIDLSIYSEEEVFEAVLESEAKRPYDYRGMAWFAWRALLYKALSWKVGGINRWQSEEARLCTGIAPAVLRALGVSFPSGVMDVEMIPPHDLYNLILGTGSFVARPDWVGAANNV